MEVEPFGQRIGKSIASGSVGAVIGVVIAEVVANSLIEISITYIFSIVFGIAFILLGIALCWRIWKSVYEQSKRIFMFVFALLVFLSGVFSFLLEKNTSQKIDLSVAGRIPMYATLGVSLSFALTFSLTEFINLGLCDKCCNTDFENHPLIGSKQQIFMLFSGSVIMGALFGILFGTIDVENDDSNHKKFKENLIWSIPIGAVIGGALGFANQWLRSSPRQYYTWPQKSEENSNI